MTDLQISHGDVRQSIEITVTHLEKAAEQIVWQVENKVWTILGYDNWDEMREAEYGGAAVIVPRADRPELVSRLRSEGLSQKEIGDTLGVSEETVRTDIRDNPNSGDTAPHTRTDSLGRERPTSYTRRPEPEPKPEPEPEVLHGEIVDQPEPLPPMSPEVRAEREREAARESALRAARNNLRSVLTYLTSTSISPTHLAKQSYGDVVDEFDLADLHYAADTMFAIAELRGQGA